MRMPDWTNIARTVVTVTLAGIGAAAGFTHTHNWADAHWQHGWLAWADAVVIEGMAIVAGFEVHRDHQAGRKGRAALLPQIVLGVSFAVQMTAQVAQAQPSPAGWLLAAMPALGFLTVVKLLMRRLPADPREPAAQQATAIRTDPPATTIPPSAPVPASRPALTMTTRLPASIRNTITDLTSKARQEGRQITIEEIRRTITLPDTMLTQLVAELNTTISNGSA